jgi:hypothetical protein
MPVPHAADPTSSLSQVQRIYRLYCALVATSPLRGDAGLGGKLLFAGGLASAGRDLLYASNVAGAASLAVSADPEQQRMAMRDGVVDFVVTSLAEALRILKNEIRKGQAVSVAVAADPRLVIQEMLDRGVQPDLLLPLTWEDAQTALGKDEWDRFLDQGAMAVAVGSESGSPQVSSLISSLISWTVNSQHARWLPRLDLCAQASLPPDDLARHRWLRLSPRYLGRLTQRVHAVAMSPAELERFRDLAAALVREKAGKDSSFWACSEPVMVSIQPFAEL